MLAYAEQLRQLGALAVHRLAGGVGAQVKQAHRVAGQRRHLGNAGAHRPGADHAHRLQSRQSSHIYAPLKRGARFSTKAAMPSA